ncbi:pyridoxamine 5'-phosphate oxidase family protein [Nonomuraea bangladeshensis]|uniref:pyridoxamine 5'-phosphate oxidase family protein n=1 Tax=Nonomuraea bangladeshensis TaxID=404385 RepID=UPI003C2B68F6
MTRTDPVPAISRITTLAGLEAIIGRPSPLVLMKELTELDDACRRMLALAPLAGFGYRDAGGRPRTTVIGGEPGFAIVESPTRLAFACEAAPSGPVALACEAGVSGAISFVFLVPGVGETLRVNGSVAERSPGRLVVAVSQTYVHCARAILRSRLWDPVAPAAPVTAVGDGPLSGAGVSGFLAATPFAVVSSWDADGGADTSPRGDPPGFVRVLDGHTLVIPDRRGNKRADTSRNLLADDRISAAMLVPGRGEVLHVSGTAVVTDDPDLLGGSALGGVAPRTALVVTVERAEVAHNPAVTAANVWTRTGNSTDPTAGAELMALTARQLGAKKPALRWVARGLAVFARPMRRIMDAVYRRALRKEGYDAR